MSIMSCHRFKDIARCLHVVNNIVLTHKRTGDKLHKLQQLLDEVRDCYKENWNLHQEINLWCCTRESFVQFVGISLGSKPTNEWSIEVWCVVDVVSKCVHSFDVYTGTSLTVSLRGASRGEAKTGYIAKEACYLHLVIHHYYITSFKSNNFFAQEASHCLHKNYFTSPKLLVDLDMKGTFGCVTVRGNRIGHPKAILNTKLFSRYPQQRMHHLMVYAPILEIDCPYVDRQETGHATIIYLLAHTPLRV